MSLRAMVWVLYESNAGLHGTAAGEANDRLVLLAIADEAADDGTNAHPSIPTIALKARCSESTAKRSILRLEAAGEILILRPRVKGRGHYNRYTMVMGRNRAEVAAAVGWPLTEPGHGDPIPPPPAPPVSKTGKRPETGHEAPEIGSPVTHDPFTRRPIGRKRVPGDPAAAADERIAAQRALAERNAERAANDVEPPADLAQARAAAAAARAALRTPALPAAELEAGDDLEEPTA